MGWHKIKSDYTWSLYSKYRRIKSDGICAYQVTDKCKLRGGKWDIREMDVSHFHSRRKFNVKFSDLNTDPSCKMCHKYFGEHKTEFEAWKLKQLGEEKFNQLLVASRVTVRKADQEIKKKALRVWLNQELKRENA